MLNNPVNLTDPSGHVCVNGSGNDEVAMSGNCGGAPNPNYDGGLLGPGWNNNSGTTSSDGGESSSSDSTGNGIVSSLPDGPACNIIYCGQPNSLSTSSAVDPFTSFNEQYDYSWLHPDPYTQKYYYRYEGSWIPVVGLAVDVGGMVVDGVSIVGVFFGPPGILASVKAQFAMSSVEFAWSGLMQATGQYEAVYDHTASLLDANTTRYTDSQEMIPITGFTASSVSAANNIKIILNGFVPYYLP